MLKYILTYLVTLYINVVGSVDLKKKELSPNLSLSFFSLKLIFSFFVQENRPNTVEFHMYKVTKMERTLPQL